MGLVRGCTGGKEPKQAQIGEVEVASKIVFGGESQSVRSGLGLLQHRMIHDDSSESETVRRVDTGMCSQRIPPVPVHRGVG
jgi:hypothetical protein